MQLSKKQNEYIINATHRWNIKSGAVRSGKSFVDTAYIVPKRIRERAGLPGLNVIMGVSKESIERNVLQPMREIYTSDLIGNINNRNVARVCGEDVYCLGAEKVSQVAKIQGASIKYCYGDEIAKWNKEVFQMLKSRLDKTYSCFDGACNPEHPTHWLKEFIDNVELDIYLQKYTIFDNPFLDPEFVKQLCKEYDGTIYYDRLILGLWKRADGAIYKRFADNPEAFKCEIVDEFSPDSEYKQFRKEDITSIEIGLDFGGNQSGHSFVARGYTDNYRDVIALKSRRITAKDEKEDIDSNRLNELFCEFIREVIEQYSVCVKSGDYVQYCNVESVFWDNAETVLGNSIRNAVEKEFPWIAVKPAKKRPINDRIRCTVKLMGAGRFFITSDCESLQTALSDAVWDKEVKDKDERLDDGSTDIDSLDAFEYTIERDMKYLIEEVENV
ncbi:terminase large subunit domain-containing protein [Mediterraneibacter gnavus]|uniref:Phage terminase, large subunit, PBSX family n=1 Tax=Mediterraneibacter gnavus (strain ATCC 29149 / DSM 114966 / JCM 6515 / VPI C7-9) TaxID=411470 RepID=A7B3T0_MEDG7|nr:terminase family protein [Mediterraneibacter gnavus]EDN77606.1 phage terminase, large subunit, PBSX family [Mediterraneibacter gnavus ATCC 29149]PQL33287.1 PBSX family phage terminase large subunit [Mediterraneibacter gnavus ATCC 29149]QEI33722.1 PBSX family phage terminase large subunit [Mediterraneibacter gnavus ATCC 29149]QHB24905.1 PBSX family phage terminase large subunit [Mediterraneibacter gnavus ATCC 29149]UZT20175.1 terminase family protein [Mediterraneibacter gnavus]